MNKKEINGQNSAATSAQEIVNLFKKAYESDEWQPTITIGDYDFALQKNSGIGWYLLRFKGTERVSMGCADYFDGKDHKWGKPLLEHTANMILDFLAQKNNGFVSNEQYNDVYKAVAQAAIVDFTEVEDLDVKYDGFDYIIVTMDGLEFDIDFSDETIKNITCDYPMSMFEITLINNVYNNINKIYEAGRKCFEKEVNA